jgi:oxalate---CoA ligase
LTLCKFLLVDNPNGFLFKNYYFSVKVKHGTAGSHLIIHKYFYEGSSLWKKIRNEEMEDGTETSQVDPSLEELQPSSSAQVHFEPMDSRHLASLPLIRSRVLKLLKSSKNNMHESNNMLLTIVETNPCSSKIRICLITFSGFC